MRKTKLRLADLEAMSKANAERREQTLRTLATMWGKPRQEIEQVVQDGYPPLMDEIVAAGTRTLTATLRAQKLSIVGRAEHRASAMARKESFIESAQVIARSLEVGSRIVELLDSIQINGKMLGDCTQREILREAERDTRRSEALADRAAWLQALAKVLEPNQTVRTADRNAVLAVLKAVTT